MSTRALAAASENAANTDTYVSSALAFPSQVYLPKINDGTGSSVAVAKHLRVESTSGAPINVLTNSGRLVLTVPGRRSAVFVAKAGTVQGEPDAWESFVQSAAPAAFQAVSAAYSQAEMTAVRDCLVKAGLMKAE
jgi:hypothetical protein